MSETHCNRRRRRQSEQSDDLSDSTIDQQNTTTINKEIENSDAPNEGQHESEYDTAGSDEEEEVDNDDNVAAGIKNKDAVSKQDGGDDDDVQRESGDGQEEEEEEEEEEEDDEDKPAKKLDDDEDRRNPQYIPKRGTFYEHDDRTMEEEMKEGGSTVEPIVEREVKEKKVWKDKEDKWDHDRYNQDEQAPKSHDELIAVYGYDIRNEEGPPRARRRRRYGRGPNKYTRNWEDEDAYGKSLGGGGNNTQTSLQKTRRSNNKNGEEFPALKATINTTGNDTIDMPIEEPIISSSAWYSNKNKNQTKQQMFPPLQSQQHEQIQKSKLFDGANNIKLNENNKTPSEPTNPAWKKDFKYTNDNNYAPTDATIDKMPLIKQNNQQHNNYNYNNHHQGNNKRQVQESVSLAASRARGRGFKPNVNNNLMANKTILETKPKGRGAGLITITTPTTPTIDSNHRRSNQHHHHDEQQQIINDIKHMNINNDGIYHHNSTRQNKNFYSQQRPPSNVQPMQQRIQQQLPSQQQQPLPDVVANRPKRYSSLRQRSAMSDGPGQQAYSQQPHNQHAQHGFYSPQAGNSHGVLKSQGFPQSHYDQASPVPTAGSAAAAAAVAPSLAGQGVISLPPPPGGQQSGGYAPPPFLVPSPQFIPPPPQTAPPSLINYVAAPNGATFTPNFQGYQSYNPTVQPQGPPAPPPELYQPQGCTYYSPAQQSHHHHHHHHQQQQVVPVRRPKAAIPILPPPENSQHHQIQRGRGRPVTNYQNSNNNSIQQIQDDVHNVSQVSEKNEIFENAESELIVGEKKDKVDSVVGLEKNVEQQQAIVDTENVLKDKVVDEEKSIKGNVIEEEKQLNSKVIVDDEKVNDLSKVESSNDEDNKKELIKSVVDIDNVEISSSTNETEVAKVVDENNVVEETAA